MSTTPITDCAVRSCSIPVPRPLQLTCEKLEVQLDSVCASRQQEAEQYREVLIRLTERAEKAESALHNCEITLGLNMIRAEEAEALLCRVASVFEIVAPTVRRLAQGDCIAAFEKTHADVRAAINHES